MTLHSYGLGPHEVRACSPRRPPLIIALLGISGRTDATHAALTLAHAHAVLGDVATVVRITLPGEACLPRPRHDTGTVRVVERLAPTPEAIEDIVVREVAATEGTSGDVVLDLPERCVADAALRSHIALTVVAVGATPFDEHMAACALDRTGATDAWLLGCGRGGGAPATAAFARAMGLARSGSVSSPRIVPATMPPLRLPEAAALLAGGGTGRVLGSGLALLSALRAIVGSPHGTVDPHVGAKEDVAGGSALWQPDRRDAGERLYDLADELNGIRDGTKPTAADLSNAPILEGWRVATRPARILIGRVSGHPNIQDGRTIETSDLYASDGSTFARTLSRYYRLGRPAPADAGAA